VITEIILGIFISKLYDYVKFGLTGVGIGTSIKKPLDGSTELVYLFKFNFIFGMELGCSRVSEPPGGAYCPPVWLLGGGEGYDPFGVAGDIPLYPTGRRVT